MITAVIIAFTLRNDDLTKKSCSLDIFQAYSYFKLLGADIHILTNITKFSYPDSVEKLITTSMISKDVYTFELPQQTSYVSSFEELFKYFLTLNVPDKFIIYYTGHGTLNTLTFPNNDEVNLYDIRRVFFGPLKKISQVSIIMDCCNPNGLYLPLIIEKGKYKLQDSDRILPCEHDVFLIASSRRHGRSISCEVGSLFTQYFFNAFRSFILGNPVCDLTLDGVKDFVDKGIIKKSEAFVILSNSIILETQSLTYYSSYFNAPIFPPYLMNIRNIYFDPFTQVFKLHRSPDAEKEPETTKKISSFSAYLLDVDLDEDQ